MEFQLSSFKSWKMTLWNCCSQYASKFGKLSSGHRTGKRQFSFQSQRKWKWSRSVVPDSLQPVDCSPPSSSIHGFSRQEYWSGLPFPSPEKAMPKNAQTTKQLHSSHMLVKQRSKFSKPGFNSTWTVNFQMFKLVLEKAEVTEMKLPTSAGSPKTKRVPEKHLFLLYWLCQSLWLCGSQ